jgi:alpha-tubulin suppressor-like RCC1 family protein/uncharacterized protein YjdB
MMTAALALVSAFACGDDPPTGAPALPLPHVPASPVITEPQTRFEGTGASHPGALGAPVGAAQAGEPLGAAERLVYVSLPSGSYPTGATALIRNATLGQSVSQPMVDGGFDPIPISAGVGDTIEIVVRTNSVVLATIRQPVPRSRPPRVVRTNPPRGKKDVALNRRVTIIFSEPMDASTLTSGSVQLTAGGGSVAGTVAVFGGGLVAEFVPATALRSNVSHRLVVTSAASDLEGDALEEELFLDFTTGNTVVPPVTSVVVLPETATLEMGDVMGDSVQASADIRTSGGVVTDREVIWASSDPTVAIVSSNGLVKARGEGSVIITATSEGRADSAHITVVPMAVAQVNATVTSSTVPLGGITYVGAGVLDRNNQILTRRPVHFHSEHPEIATVDEWGVVRGVSRGVAVITATSEGVSGSVDLTVGFDPRTWRIEIDPPVAAVSVDETILFSSRAYHCPAGDGNCTEITNEQVSWQVADTDRATIDQSGRLTGQRPGAVDVVASIESVAGTAMVTIVDPAASQFASVSAGYYFTCALTAGGGPYCWGQNPLAELGIGRIHELAEWQPAAVAPVKVTGELSLASLSVGGWHSCGITTAGAVYCWGYGLQGQLGEGDASIGTCPLTEEFDVRCSAQPVAVSGLPAVRALYAGGLQTCALTADGTAYCWGGDRYGQIGDGGGVTHTGMPPTSVASERTWASLSPGGRHMCGLTTDGKAYCWGWNYRGQLGDGTTTNRDVPTPVAGDLTFVGLAGWGYHTCGVTVAGDAYCWGDNYYGQLGDGTRTSSLTPVAVKNGKFTHIGGGEWHTCGLRSDGTAHCWGSNWSGELGISGPTSVAEPVPVTGGLTFRTLTVGASHACGLASTDRVYCWGMNLSGQLGDGTAINRHTPVLAAGQR